MSKLYYDDPLHAAIMTEDFGVRYLKSGLLDDTTAKFWQILCHAPYFGKGEVQINLTDNPYVNIYIHPKSLPIFEPMVGDLVQRCNYVTHETDYIVWGEGWDWLDDKHNGTMQIIQRNGKHFYMPKREGEE